MEHTKALENEGAVLLAQSDGCSVWQFCNENGEGTMTAYEVFPGVMLSFNDFHMEYYHSGFVIDNRILAIDHCREGQMEYVAGSGMVGYTTAGDIKLDRRKQHLVAVTRKCRYVLRKIFMAGNCNFSYVSAVFTAVSPIYRRT